MTHLSNLFMSCPSITILFPSYGSYDSPIQFLPQEIDSSVEYGKLAWTRGSSFEPNSGEATRMRGRPLDPRTSGRSAWEDKVTEPQWERKEEGSSKREPGRTFGGVSGGSRPLAPSILVTTLPERTTGPPGASSSHKLWCHTG